MKYTRISSIIVTLLLLIQTPSLVNVSAANTVEFLKLSNDLYVMNGHILKYFTELTPVLGEQNILVIFVEFTDVKHSISMDSILDRLLDVRRYYVEVSYGQMIPIWISYDWSDNAWLTLPHNKAYYGAPSGSSLDARWYELVVDSIKAADPYVDYRYYKRVLIFHAGGDEASTGNPYDIWSFAVIDLSISTDDGEVKLNVAVVSEEDPIGVIAHELGHTFYLPDLYDYSGQTEFVGRWCLMAIGAWNGAPCGSSPAELCSWCRLKLGWIPDQGIIDVEPSTITNITLLALETPVGYKVARIRIDDKHYYLIEVRVRKSFDQYLPREGVLILYVDETKGSGEGIVRVIDSTPGDSDVDNGEWSTGMVYRNDSLMLTIRIGNRVGEVYSIATNYKTHKEITISPTIVEVGGKITIHVEYDEAINHVIVFLEDKWLTTVYPETHTNTMNITIPIPSVSPGTYKLKVKVTGKTSTYTEVFIINVTKRVEPKIHVLGPTKLKPETTTKYITYIEVNGQPYDPDEVKAYLINSNGEVASEASIERVGKGIYIITISVPKIKDKEAYYILKIEAMSNKAYIFSTTRGYPIYVGISLSDIDATLSKLNNSIKELIGYLEEIRGDTIYIRTNIGVIKTTIESINASLIDIKNGIAILNSNLGIVKANLSIINAKIESIKNGIALINSSIGLLYSKLESIGAVILEIKGDVAVINTTLGEVLAKLDDINTKVSFINESIISIDTSLGDIIVKIDDVRENTTTLIKKIDVINGKVGTIINTITSINSNLTQLNAELEDMYNELMLLKTDIGFVIANMTELKPTITEIKNNVVYINTTLGTIKAELDTLNAKAKFISDTLIEVKTSLGNIVIDVSKILDILPALITKIDYVNDTTIQISAMAIQLNNTLSQLQPTVEDIHDNLMLIKTSIGYILTEIKYLKPIIEGIKNGVMYINTSMGLIKTALKDLNVKTTEIKDGVVLIKTDLGTIRAKLSALNAKIIKAEGNLVVLNSTIGEIRASLIDINAKLEKIQGDVAIIHTSIGIIKGTLKEIVNDTAIIKTDIGELKLKIPEHLKELISINRIKNSLEYQKTINYAIIGLLVITIILSLISLMRKK